MPIGGRRPKPPGQAVNRNKRLYDWTQVENIPNRAEPRLPARRHNGKPWPGWVKRRWDTWRQMPHSREWIDSDWAFAADTAELLARTADDGGSVALWSEIRLRERTLGVTWDSRQQQRLRYVAPKTDEDEAPGSVTRLDTYRDL